MTARAGALPARTASHFQPVAKFKGRRNSMGGFGAGFKGSCSVLGRTIRALGEDIVDWLAAPTNDAQLGDLK